ncbi:hypothetical protein IMY05_019G0023600 [Salix suchowensis]|nr:hypothetical protein IMY05_019G0023600 [Salix suchowensis]
MVISGAKVVFGGCHVNLLISGWELWNAFSSSEEDCSGLFCRVFTLVSDVDTWDISEEEFQVDELADSSATSDTSKSNEVSVLTQNQEFILEAIKRLDDPQLQRVYLDNLLKNFNKTEQPPVNPPTRTMLPSTSTNTYDLTKILSKKKTKTSITIPELHSEIKTLKTELQTLKQAQQKDSAILQNLLSKVENQSDSDSEEEATDPDLQALHALHDTNLDQIDNAFLDVLSQISSKKYIVKLSLVFSDDFKLDTIALFDTDFYPNLIRIAKPLHDRLRKSPEPWSDLHTQIVRQIKAQNSYKTNHLILMPPRPQRDKGKAPATKPTKTQTPKNPVLASPKLLADAIKEIKDTKSWYDKVTQEEDDYSSLKDPKLEDISNEIIIRLSKNPGLLEAINKGYKDFASDSQSLSGSISKPITKTQAGSSSPKPLLTLQNQIQISSNFSKNKSKYFEKPKIQNIWTVENGFPNHDVHLTISKIFPKDFHFKSWDISKSRLFYENILKVTGSVTFKHFYKHPTHTDPAYSTCTIQRIISPEKWSRTPPYTPILFPTDIQKQNPHFPTYTYWDYEQAWFDAFLIQNQGNSHSWLFFFNTTIDTSNLPHWFRHCSSSSASSPVISLGNDNEDDCYGILPPVKHASIEVIKRR